MLSHGSLVLLKQIGAPLCASDRSSDQRNFFTSTISTTATIATTLCATTVVCDAPSRRPCTILRLVSRTFFRTDSASVRSERTRSLGRSARLSTLSVRRYFETDLREITVPVHLTTFELSALDCHRNSFGCEAAPTFFWGGNAARARARLGLMLDPGCLARSHQPKKRTRFERGSWKQVSRDGFGSRCCQKKCYAPLTNSRLMGVTAIRTRPCKL